MKLALALVLNAILAAVAAGASIEGRAAANPIRKVVTMLQAMQKKVEEEGEKADELMSKFLCYCKTNRGGLAESIQAAETKIPELTASIEAAGGQSAQLKADLASHQADRSAAKTAMDEATAIREKEKAAYDKALSESQTNLAALNKAVAALEKGAAGAFLQTSDAAALNAFVKNSKSMLEADREDILSFLSGGYAPVSGEIIGILKQIGDEMNKAQADMIVTEEKAVADYEGLISAKKQEVAALSQSIEEKLSRQAEAGVQLAAMQNDLEDTAAALEQNKAFVADLEKNCESKAAVHEEEKKKRAEEVVALVDTIKILNDDDALDLFKKTLPSAGASFMQMQVTSASMRAQASELLAQARSSLPHGMGRERLDFIALALRGRKIGFEKVLQMIDELVATLKQEQVDDEHKKEYCGAQIDAAEDKQKELERAVQDVETVIAETQESIATLVEEVKALEEGIKALDKSVAEATEQRKEENTNFKELMASNTAAKDLLAFAKNRLHKFYNPKLYKEAPKRELSSEDRIYENMGGEITTAPPSGIAGTGIEAFLQMGSRARHSAAPPPPPETAAAYMSKTEESHGVMAMMDLLTADLEKEMAVAETEEKNAQDIYERTMKESAEKRASDSKALTDKEAAKADLATSLETSEAQHKATGKELMATGQFIASLHGECDWLLQYFDMRKEARADEVDSLTKAKAVLSGADFSLLQRGSQSARARKFRLRGA